MVSAVFYRGGQVSARGSVKFHERTAMLVASTVTFDDDCVFHACEVVPNLKSVRLAVPVVG